MRREETQDVSKLPERRCKHCLLLLPPLAAATVCFAAILALVMYYGAVLPLQNRGIRVEMCGVSVCEKAPGVPPTEQDFVECAARHEAAARVNGTVEVNVTILAFNPAFIGAVVSRMRAVVMPPPLLAAFGPPPPLHLKEQALMRGAIAGCAVEGSVELPPQGWAAFTFLCSLSTGIGLQDRISAYVSGNDTSWGIRVWADVAPAAARLLRVPVSTEPYGNWLEVLRFPGAALSVPIEKAWHSAQNGLAHCDILDLTTMEFPYLYHCSDRGMDERAIDVGHVETEAEHKSWGCRGYSDLICPNPRPNSRPTLDRSGQPCPSMLDLTAFEAKNFAYDRLGRAAKEAAEFTKCLMSPVDALTGACGGIAENWRMMPLTFTIRNPTHLAITVEADTRAYVKSAFSVGCVPGQATSTNTAEVLQDVAGRLEDNQTLATWACEEQWDMEAGAFVSRKEALITGLPAERLTVPARAEAPPGTEKREGRVTARLTQPAVHAGQGDAPLESQPGPLRS